MRSAPGRWQTTAHRPGSADLVHRHQSCAASVHQPYHLPAMDWSGNWKAWRRNSLTAATEHSATTDHGTNRPSLSEPERSLWINSFLPSAPAILFSSARLVINSGKTFARRAQSRNKIAQICVQNEEVSVCREGRQKFVSKESTTPTMEQG